MIKKLFNAIVYEWIALNKPRLPLYEASGRGNILLIGVYTDSNISRFGYENCV